MQVHDRAVVHGQYSTVCVGHVSFFLISFVLFLCVYVYVCVWLYMVWILNHMIGFVGLYIPFFFFIFVISPSSLGDVTGLPGMFRTCYHRSVRIYIGYFSGSEVTGERSWGRVQHL